MRFALFGTVALGLIALGARTRAADPVPTDSEKKTIALIVKAGGKAAIDPKLPKPARVSAKFDSAIDKTLIDLLIDLKKAPALGALGAFGALDVFDATQVTEKGLAGLKDLPHLRVLALGKSKMTATRTTAIGRCKELRVLYLGNSGLTDSSLAGLKALTRLESLDISDNPQVGNDGMETVKLLERLRALHLGKTAVSDKGLMALKDLDGLRSLSVFDTKVTADAADAFAEEMPNLRSVQR